MEGKVFRVALWLAIVSAACVTADSAEPCPHCQKTMDHHARAGYPQKVAPWARPSVNPAYDGYYVGGGAPFSHGSGPCNPADGVWGWDYFGRVYSRRVALGWWHGERWQGGAGAYKTDGPKVLHHE